SESAWAIGPGSKDAFWVVQCGTDGGGGSCSSRWISRERRRSGRAIDHAGPHPTRATLMEQTGIRSKCRADSHDSHGLSEREHTLVDAGQGNLRLPTEILDGGVDFTAPGNPTRFRHRRKSRPPASLTTAGLWATCWAELEHRIGYSLI